MKRLLKLVVAGVAIWFIADVVALVAAVVLAARRAEAKMSEVGRWLS